MPHPRLFYFQPSIFKLGAHYNLAALVERNQGVHLLLSALLSFAGESSAPARFADTGGVGNKSHQFQRDFFFA